MTARNSSPSCRRVDDDCAVRCRAAGPPRSGVPSATVVERPYEKRIGSQGRAGLRFRRLAVFSATLLLASVAGWRLLPILEPQASVQPYRVRVKVELPASAGLPQSNDKIRAELIRPESIQDALAAAGIDSHVKGVGPADEVGEQLEVETLAGQLGIRSFGRLATSWPGQRAGSGNRSQSTRRGLVGRP